MTNSPIVVEHGAPTDYSTPDIRDLDLSSQLVYPPTQIHLNEFQKQLLKEALFQKGDVLEEEVF